MYFRFRQLGDGYDAIGMQTPMTDEDKQISRFDERCHYQRCDTLVHFHGEVSSAGYNRKNNYEIWERII